ncbi:MAG: spore maturation protein [Clostridia bacterium]|nr:spore maturation protein [Clostridia bacterium]
MLEKISLFILPTVIFLVAFIVLVGRRRDYFSCFLEGAARGAKGAFSLLPSMCALIISVNMLLGSGISDDVSKALSPMLSKIGIPSEILPLLLLRPFSGSASLAFFDSLLRKCGPDTFVGIVSSVIIASTDTFIYVICIYFSKTKIKRTRYLLPVCIIVSVLSVFVAILVSRIFLNIF